MLEANHIGVLRLHNDKKKLEIFGLLSIILLSGITIQSAFANIELVKVDILCPLESLIGQTEIIDFLVICGIQGADIPVITLNGDAIVEVTLGSEYIELGATATDTIDGDLTSSIVQGGDTVDVNVVNAYLITFNVEDSAGNDAVQKTRVVVVASVGISVGGVGSPVGGAPLDPEQLEQEAESLQDAFDQAIADAINSIETREITVIETVIETVVQFFFEFAIVDDVHEDVRLNSLLDRERLGIRWSSGMDIVIVSATIEPSPFTFTFEDFPAIKRGSGAVISTDFIQYDLNIPRNLCSETITANCVEKIRYEVPITVNAVINATAVSDRGSITIDLTEDPIDIIILIILSTLSITVVAGLVLRSRGRSGVIQTVRRAS